MPDINLLVKRFEQLKERRREWEPFFRDVRDYIRPRKGKVDSNTLTIAQPNTNKLFDSTATEANRILALSMQNSLCPSSVVWFNLKVPDGHEMAELNNDPEVNGWFKNVATKMFFGMHTSNFYSVIGEAFLDYCSFGTICVLSEEDDVYSPDFNGIVYKSLPIGEYVFAEDRRGVPDTLFWGYKLSARQAAQQFGKKNLSEKILETLENSPDKEFEFLRCVMPQDDYYRGKKDNKEFPYTSIDIDLKSKEKVNESGYHEFPYSIGRFSKESSELWGRSPADVSMANIKVLNKLMELELRALNKAVDPPIIAPHQGIIGSFKLLPAAINYSREPERIKFLPFEGRFDLSNLKANELRQSIRSMFMADQLVMPEKPNMTASEVLTLKEQVQKMLGPTVARFESEVLSPLVMRSFGIGYRTRQFPPVPEKLAGLDEVDVEFIGSLAKAQKLSDVTALSQWFGIVGQVLQISPSAVDIINGEEALRVMGDRLNIPAEVLRSNEEIMAIREVKEAQLAEQQQNEQMLQIAQGVGGGHGVKALMEAGKEVEENVS